MSEKIIDKETLEMYESDQAKYSIIVNRRRAFPEVRDGLKPVQRRVIYAAYKDGLTSPGKRDKSASLVGETMKRYHPHGDSSIYDAIVTLESWFKIKYPIFYGQGSWGNISGAGPAAQRYTECSLSEFGYDVLIDELNQSNNIVDWIQTYKRNNDREPEFLPAKLPLLLINGTFGIGVGMTVNIPSHNLREVIKETQKLIKNPNADVFLIPDLPQECKLIDTDWKSICDNGYGSFKVRGKIITEQDPKTGNYTLRIVSLPDNTNTGVICDKILKMVEAKQLPMIKDVIDDLQDSKPNIIIQLRPGADPTYVKQVIYTKTTVQSTVSVNFEAVDVDGINTRRFSYKDYLLSFIDQRANIKFRLYCNKLQQALTRHHRIDAFIKVLESGEIDNIINMIKKSKG
jgi:DNA gyrase subunit A